jgi:lysophospholipase L1-like esterase
MLHRSENTPNVPSPQSSLLWKIPAAVLAFCMVIGGWLGFQRYRALNTPLPGYDVAVNPCTLWFIGSSSIRRWPALEQEMRPWSAVNRGMNGARLGTIHRRMLNEPAGRSPAAIIFYGGDNDIGAGRTAADTFQGTVALLTDVRRMFGPVPVFLLSLKPSPARWSNFPLQTAYNSDLKAYSQQHPGITFVDTVPALLRDGRPGPYYRADGLHMNADGYTIVRKRLIEEMQSNLPTNLLDRCVSVKKQINVVKND